MERDFFEGLNLQSIETPAFVVSEEALTRNLEILDSVQKRTGCKILLAVKGFAMFSTFPLVRKYLAWYLRQLSARGSPGTRGIRP